MALAASQDQRRLATALGATTTRLAAPTGPWTTAAPPATQPARTTPAAQTTALASIVLKVMKPPLGSRSRQGRRGDPPPPPSKRSAEPLSDCITPHDFACVRGAFLCGRPYTGSPRRDRLGPTYEYPIHPSY